MRQKIKYFILLLLFVSAFFCGGCWDNRELDTISIVTGVGLDSADKPGETKYSFQIQKAQSGGGGGGSFSQKGSESGNRNFFILSNQDKGLLASINALRKSSTRDIYMYHNQVIIFGRDKAKQGIKQDLDAFIRDREMRMESWLIMADATANEILSAEIVQEKNSSVGLARMMNDEELYTDSYSVSLLNFVSKIEENTTAPVLPIVKVQDNGESKDYVITGLAVFKESKLAGEMDIELTRGYSWVSGHYKKSYLDVESEYGYATAIVTDIKHSIKSIIDANGIPGLNVELKGEFAMGEMKGFENMAPTEVANICEKMVNEAIVDKIQKTLDYTHGINCDIFQIGNRIYRDKPREWKSMEGRWDEMYPKTFINVKTDFKFASTGKSDNSLEMDKEHF